MTAAILFGIAVGLCVAAAKWLRNTDDAPAIEAPAPPSIPPARYVYCPDCKCAECGVTRRL